MIHGQSCTEHFSIAQKHGKEGAFRCSLTVLLPSIRSALIEKVICWCKKWQVKESKRASKTGCHM